MKNIIFVSPPAAGKGTQSRMISERYNIPHISTGSILRNEIKRNSEIGLKIREEINLGNLIDDNIIINLLKQRINSTDCENGYILDGFPRTLKQAELYDEMLVNQNKEINYVFYLNLDEESAYKRTVGRITCADCQTVYNDLFLDMKPINSGICDKCNGLLIKRSDDSLEIFKKRYENYLKLTKPLIDYYRRKNLLYEIDSSINKEYTFEQITKIMDNGDLND